VRARVQKWGNSLAIRIPKMLAKEALLEQNSEVELELRDGAIVLKAVNVGRYSLEELLERVTPENLHGEADTGPAVGSEEW